MLNFKKKSEGWKIGKKAGFLFALMIFSSILMVILAKFKVIHLSLKKYVYNEIIIVLTGIIYLMIKKK